MSTKRSTDDWMPEDRVQPVDIKRLSDTTVEVTPRQPLPPGQYLLGGPGVVVAYYDFGVAAVSSKRGPPPLRSASFPSPSLHAWVFYRRVETAARLAGGETSPQYTEYLIHFTGGNSNLKHVFEGTLKAGTVDRARAGASRLGTDSQVHAASFEISTVDANGHVHESLSSRQIDDWLNTTAFSQGLRADPGAARAAGLAVVADRALQDQGKENPRLRDAKKRYGLGSAMQDDLSYLAFGAGGLDQPGAQEKRDQQVRATAGALGTTSPQ